MSDVGGDKDAAPALWCGAMVRFGETDKSCRVAVMGECVEVV